MKNAETLAKIASMEAELAALKKKLEEPEWVNPIVTPIGTRMSCAQIDGLGNFKTTKSCDDWEFVFQTMLEIAACDGVEPLKVTEKQWFLDIDSASIAVVPHQWTPTGMKLLSISPPFATEQQARAALDKIGADNIMRMIKIRSFMEV